MVARVESHRTHSTNGHSPQNGHAPACLLVTADGALARRFRAELRGCAPALAVEVRSDWLDALQESERGYGWVAIDLDWPVAPEEAVRLVRLSWPRARVALLSCWWSERDQVARDLADAVVHKPLRAAELACFLDGATQAAGASPVIPAASLRSPSAPTPASPPLAK